MKRITAWMIVLLTVFIGIPCSAASGFYCEYTPKSEKSTVFYIDLYSSDEVSAAVMELSFDESFVEYREVSAVEKTSTVRSACDNGNVRIAFADSDAVNGRLDTANIKANRIIPQQQIDSLIDFTKDRIVKTGQGITSGNTDISPLTAKPCEYCDYKMICGITGKEDDRVRTLAPLPDDFLKEEAE